MAQNALRQLKIGLLLLLLILVSGTVGYMIIESWDFLDSLYMTIITITTTGFEEVRPLSPTGKIFTVVLLIFSFGTIVYLGGRGVQFLLENKIFRRRRMNKKIEDLTNHYIVCGFGRMGHHICSELVQAKVPFVVIENNPDQFDELDNLGYLYYMGDATNDEILIKAGVKKAKGMVCVLSSDAENVFATLSAKVLNPKIYVVARAVQEETDSKLLKAGADRVVKPYELGGIRMAHLLLRPGVIEFIEVVARNKSVGLNLEEIVVKKDSAMHGKTLGELPLRSKFNVIIVSIQKEKAGEFIYNPGSDTQINEGDKLIAIGEKSKLYELKKL